jgi:hypothetical protein
MSKSKKIFLLLSAVFLILLFYASYDISQRTTFPGSKSQIKERLKKQYLKKDSLKADTTHR